MTKEISSELAGPSVELSLARKREILARRLREKAAPKIYPASHGQQRLWVLDRLFPGSRAAYNISVGMRLDGDLRVDMLRRSLAEMVRRHETLRTSIATLDDQPVQMVASPGGVPLALADLSGLAARRREGEARRLASEQSARPFELSRGPLWRVLLMRLSAAEHIAAFTMHHIVSDGWSMGVLVRELTALYAACAVGARSPLAELPIQYADYAVWQRQWLSEGALEDQLGYWRERLADLGRLELPTDRPEPAERALRGGRLNFVIPPVLAGAVRGLSRETGASVFMVLLAAFQLLLGRIAGQEDVAVGSPVANRTRTETEGLIGLFINTLVLRTRLAGEESFHALLQRVREVVLGGYSHQDLPFDRLVQELRPDRDSSPSPFFQVFFDFQLEGGPTTGPQLELPGVRLRPYPIGMDTTQFALSLSLIDGGKGLSATLGYDADLFDRATIRRLAEHFERLLGGAVRAPETGIWDLPLLGEGERHQLVREWNDTAAAGHEGLCVHELFALQAARSAERPAVVLDGEELSYGELEERAAELARRLERRGVGAEVRVGLCVERSFEMVVGLLAVLKAGGCYVPLDPGYPSERLAYMVADSGISLVLAQERTRGRLPEAAGLEVLALDAPPAAAAEAGVRPRLRALPDNLAYVLYTSGSTGRPKGVAVSHRSVVSYLAACLELYPGNGSGSVVHSSLSFDLTVTSLLSPWLRGEKMELLPEGPGGEVLAEALEHRTDLSLVKLTPAHLELLARRLSPQAAARCARGFVIGGEELPAETLLDWRQRAPQTLLFNEYGPTEATVGCCVHRVGERTGAGRVPIGRPIRGARVQILSPQLHPVPIQVTGELFLAGAGLARGYLGRPDLTAERFVPDGLGGIPGGRLYRTGDLARSRADGELEFLGRTDHQVKVRGYRIELGEIELALGEHPQVRRAVVTLRDGETGGKRLVAYVVPSAGEAPRMAELREFLTDRLPGHMVPSAFVVLSELPLTANGKVDRKALPAPAGERVDDGSAYVAPRTPLEEQLAQIWAEVLGLEKVGVHDNFFELGGDSILCLQVASRAKRAGLKKVSSRLMFQHPTVAGLLAVAGVGEGPVAVGDVAPSGGSLPLLPIQHWFFAQEPAEPHHFNQAVLLELRGSAAAAPGAGAAGFGAGSRGVAAALRAGCRGRLAPGGVVVVVGAGTAGPLGPSPRRRSAGPWLRRPERCSAAWTWSGARSGGLPGSCWEVRARTACCWSSITWRWTGCRGASCSKSSRFSTSVWSRAWSWRLCRSRRRCGVGRSVLAHARSPELESEAASGRAERPVGGRPLPLDLDSGADAVGWERSVSASLEGEETRVLLQELTRAYRAQMDEGLLSALARSLAEWTSERWLLVDLEGHGREPEGLGEDLDLSRTVGWLTSQYPVLLELEGGGEPRRRCGRCGINWSGCPGGASATGCCGTWAPRSCRGVWARSPRRRWGSTIWARWVLSTAREGREAGSPCREKRWARRAAPGDAGSIFWRPLPWSPGGVCSCVCPTARGVIGRRLRRV